MRSECLAIIERGDFGDSPAAAAGREAGCLFCDARGGTLPSLGERAVRLNGCRAGEIFVVDREIDRVASTNYDLVARLPLRPPTEWLPKVSFRDAFVIDELAVWFCSGGSSTVRFQWSEHDLLEVARVLWEKRTPITSGEMIAVMLAHGLPGEWQLEATKLLRFGRETLIAARNRPPIKNRRWHSFDGVFEDRRRFTELFI